MTTKEIAQVRTMEDVHPSGMWARDLLLEAFAGIFARPGRMVLTILGTMIGLAALVATLGLSRTASNHIIGRFDELAATEITVSSVPAGEGEADDCNDLEPGISPEVAEVPDDGIDQDCD